MSDIKEQSDMVAQVGGAILLAETEWTPKSGISKERAMALAAIEAMREPPEAVAREAFNHIAGDDWLDFLRGHRAMIDAALTQTTPADTP